MNVDILFLAKNRLAFTKASIEALIKNTDWSYVRYLWVIDDGSIDGTAEYLRSLDYPCQTRWDYCGLDFNGPAAVLKAYAVNHPDATEVFAKLDNDVIVTPNWLQICADVMIQHSELDLLGIEPWMSRTPHYIGGVKSLRPELTGPLHIKPQLIYGYAICDSIGGIGLMRRSSFQKFNDMNPHSIYGGFTEWQLRHPSVRKGWVSPALSVFLLDRLPVEPWRSLSKQYITKGWQRDWSSYSLNEPHFWEWWNQCQSV